MDWKNNRYATSKVDRKNDLTEEEEQSLKDYIDYMAPMNHLLSIQAVKAFGWAIAKKVPIQTDLIQRLGQVLNGTEILN